MVETELEAWIENERREAAWQRRQRLKTRAWSTIAILGGGAAGLTAGATAGMALRAWIGW